MSQPAPDYRSTAVPEPDYELIGRYFDNPRAQFAYWRARGFRTNEMPPLWKAREQLKGNHNDPTLLEHW